MGAIRKASKKWSSGLSRACVSRRQNHPHNLAVPLSDGGEKKFNWASLAKIHH